MSFFKESITELQAIRKAKTTRKLSINTLLFGVSAGALSQVTANCFLVYSGLGNYGLEFVFIYGVFTFYFVLRTKKELIQGAEA